MHLAHAFKSFHNYGTDGVFSFTGLSEILESRDWRTNILESRDWTDIIEFPPFSRPSQKLIHNWERPYPTHRKPVGNDSDDDFDDDDDDDLVTMKQPLSENDAEQMRGKLHVFFL